MKKIISVFMIICSLLCLFGCSGYYDPVESTAEESVTVMTLSIGGEEYEVRYELYRALFLNNKKTVDGGDDSVWTGSNKDEYINRIDEIIIQEAARIYSAFALCKEIGIDIYSDSVERKIREYVKASVNGDGVEGFGGSYENYLEYLKEKNLNYSVQALLFRYGIALDKIEKYYISTSTEDINSNEINTGALEYTKQDVEDFYYSDECARVLRMHLSLKYDNNPEQRLARVKEALDSAAIDGVDALKIAMINNGSLSTTPEMRNGYVTGRHTLDKGIYGELTEAIFSLRDGEVSNPVKIHDGTKEYYYFLYRLDKSNEHFTECYGDIAYIYALDMIGSMLDDKELALIESATASSALSTIDRSAISMD